jgi:hypothetical protein
MTPGVESCASRYLYTPNIKISPRLSTLLIMKRLKLFLSLLLTFALVPIPFANSIEMPGGKLAIGTNRVLTLAIGIDARTPFCGLAMITDKLVVTAAHCVAKNKTDDGTLYHPLEKLYVTQPGVDVRLDDVTTRVKVLKVFFPVRYEAFWDEATGDFRGTKNDIAFLFLEKPLVPGYSIPVATQQEFESIQTSGFAVDHFGYGMQNQYGADGKPYSLTSLTRARKYYFETDPTSLISGDYGFPSVCGGDSGSPVYGTFNGIYKLIAVVNLGGGCFPNLGPTSGTISRPVFSYLDSALKEWNQFESELKAKKDAEAKVIADKAATVKKTISCIKGKLSKKVTVINPKCPTGYKKKK